SLDAESRLCAPQAHAIARDLSPPARRELRTAQRAAGECVRSHGFTHRGWTGVAARAARRLRRPCRDPRAATADSSRRIQEIERQEVKRLRCGAVLILAAALGGATHAPEAKRWWSHVLFLADDKLEGRETGSEGHRKAAEYVAGEFERSGLKPA